MVNRAIHESISWTIDSTHTGEGIPHSDPTHLLHDHPVEDPRTLPTLHALLSPFPKSIYGEDNIPGGGEIESVDVDMGTTMNFTSTPTTTTTTTATTGIDTTAGANTPLVPPHRPPLVYVHIYNPVRTYLKQFLKQHFHVSFGDEDRDRTCVLNPPVPYHDYISPFQGGGETLLHCRAVGVEYFIFRMGEPTVRWVVDEVLSRDVRKYLLDGGIVELTMAEE